MKHQLLAVAKTAVISGGAAALLLAIWWRERDVIPLIAGIGFGLFSLLGCWLAFYAIFIAPRPSGAPPEQRKQET